MSTDAVARTIPVLTPWSTTPGYSPAEEFGITPEQAALYDRLFSQLVLELVYRDWAWLPEALIAAGVQKVGAAPGHFELVLRDGQRHLVPEIGSRLQLLPWQLPGEIAH